MTLVYPKDFIPGLAKRLDKADLETYVLNTYQVQALTGRHELFELAWTLRHNQGNLEVAKFFGRMITTLEKEI